ncbi:MAG TPA: hypothetical protein VEV17_04765 [Bryobacteraceae bacterium]|nr:hypothetical protein [Bryobacteraceae bacterium]
MPAAVPCPAARDVPPGTTLEDLARSVLGSPRYAIAIALATNARTGDGFRYIANPDDLTGVARVCVPSKREARELQRSWEAYEGAVSAARLPRRYAVRKMLLTLRPDQPVNVIAWVREDQADRFKAASSEWVKRAPSETWVTIEPHLQEFCRAFVRDHRPDQAKLTRRLEQRLGLSPASSKTYFVRMRLDQPGPSVIFRPCVDPAADEAGCSLGPPSKAPPDHRLWFYQQYYSSYGQSLISEFPWTALGYTFDWAPGPSKASPFQRTGESEFVIRKDAPIEVLDVVTTSQYCAPQAF